MTRPSVLQLGCQSPQSHILETERRRRGEGEEEKKTLVKKKIKADD